MNGRNLAVAVLVWTVWPQLTSGQPQTNMPALGFLSARSLSDSVSVEESFRKGLGEMGYSDGRNVRLVHRWADGHFDRLPQLANDLVGERVAVMAAVGGDMTVAAAKNATKSIPIVMVTGTDPARTGLVASLNRPGGNVTGVTLYSEIVEPKRVELLRELVPTAKKLAVLINPNDPIYAAKRASAEEAARTLRWDMQVFEAGTEAKLGAVFSTFAGFGVGGVLVSTSPFFSTHRAQIIALAERHKMPAIYDSRVQVSEGGLMSYGTSYTETYRQAGLYAGRILKGEKPADLPVLLPTKFELTINLKTAKALGLTVPATLLATADEVIE